MALRVVLPKLVLLLCHNFVSYYKAILITWGSANIDSVPRAQGKLESNMAYPYMFVHLASRNRTSSDRSIKESAVVEARRAAGAS